MAEPCPDCACCTARLCETAWERFTSCSLVVVAVGDVMDTAGCPCTAEHAGTARRVDLPVRGGADDPPVVASGWPLRHHHAEENPRWRASTVIPVPAGRPSIAADRGATLQRGVSNRVDCARTAAGGLVEGGAAQVRAGA